jgi:hypothetical protein
MTRHAIRPALSLLAAAALLSACGEDFATGPDKFPGALDIANWADTLVAGERRAVTVRVLDAQGREVLDRTVQWTIGSPSVVGVATAGGTAVAAAGSEGATVLSVPGGSSVEMRGLLPGISDASFEFSDALFHETTAERRVTVVAAGLVLASASDTTLTALGDTATMIASALGRSEEGEDVPLAGLGVQWARVGPGATELLGEGDTVRVVALQDGTDTLVAGHSVCRGGAQCVDTVLVHVVTEAAPPPPPPPPPPAPLTISPTTAEKAVTQVQQFAVTGGPGPYVWSVDGVDGGASATGTIDPDGVYVAPATVPAGGSVEVCVRSAGVGLQRGSMRRSSATARGMAGNCALVTITAAPTAGADVVVVNDVDSWSLEYGSTPGNATFFGNLVDYTGSGSRTTGHTVMYYTGAGAGCGAGCTTTGWYTGALGSTLTGLGYTLLDESGSLLNIPSDVKVIFIWMPRNQIGTSEVNALKQFAAEGGRLVVVGENGGYYGAGGIAIENQLLADLGSQLVNQGDCSWGPGVIESSHQVVEGVDELSLACVSTMIPGPNDWVVAREPETNKVLVAVTRIDLTPLP